MAGLSPSFPTVGSVLPSLLKQAATRSFPRKKWDMLGVGGGGGGSITKRVQEREGFKAWQRFLGWLKAKLRIYILSSGILVNYLHPGLHLLERTSREAHN